MCSRVCVCVFAFAFAFTLRCHPLPSYSRWSSRGGGRGKEETKKKHQQKTKRRPSRMARSGGNATRICEVDEASQHGLAPPSLHSCTAAESALDMINPRSLYIQKRTQRLVPFPPTVENLNNLLQSASKTDMFPPRSSPSQLPFASHYSDYLPVAYPVHYSAATPRRSRLTSAAQRTLKRRPSRAAA